MTGYGRCCVEGRTLVRSTRLKDFTLCRNKACAYRQTTVAQVTKTCVSQDDEKSYYLFLKDLQEKEKNDLQ